MTRSFRRLASAPLAALLLIAFVAAGCGGSDNSSTTSAPASTGGTGTQSSAGASGGADAKVAAEVPSDIKSKGTLKIAADATYAPNEFIGKDGKTVEGMDADLAKALGDVMGLKVDVVNQTFDSIIPGLAAGKYDLGMSSFTDTKEREKVVDFVTYFSAGTSFYVNADGGPTINGLSDLCGHKVAVEKGTTQQDDATAQKQKCDLTLSVFPDQNGVNLALSSGRADVAMADSPVAAYQVELSDGKFKLTGKPYGTAPYGIAVPKDSGMDKPVLDALKVLMKDGTYTQILKKWGIQEGAIDNPQINAAVS